MAFKPTHKDNYESKIENYLLNGYIIRYDMRGDTPLEVVGREHKGRIKNTSNIGQFNGEIIENIYCSHDMLYNVVNRLEKVYSLRKVSCEFSGCCQYSTYAYYIDGEFEENDTDVKNGRIWAAIEKDDFISYDALVGIIKDAIAPNDSDLAYKVEDFVNAEFVRLMENVEKKFA